MNKIFDVFTTKRRKFVVKERDMIEILKIIDSAQSSNRMIKYCGNGIYIGNCNWAEQPDLWYIQLDLTDEQWKTLLLECKNKNYQLVIKDKTDSMYFEKN